MENDFLLVLNLLLTGRCHTELISIFHTPFCSSLPYSSQSRFFFKLRKGCPTSHIQNTTPLLIIPVALSWTLSSFAISRWRDCTTFVSKIKQEFIQEQSYYTQFVSINRICGYISKNKISEQGHTVWNLSKKVQS